MSKTICLSVLLCCIALTTTVAGEVAPRSGSWRAWLDCPGGELPFDLRLLRANGDWRGWIINGGERVTLPEVTWDGTVLMIDIPHYDATIRAQPTMEGLRLDGEWKKRSAADEWSTLPFHAFNGTAPRFSADPQTGEASAGQSVAGRWSVKFARDDDPAIGVFEVEQNGATSGTFLTTTGDYGYLAGDFTGDRLRLSTFNGSHAFLFDARLQPDGTLKGDFWSRDVWHDTWTAKRDPSATLPDPFKMTPWAEGAKLSSDKIFKDLDGKSRSILDAAYEGKVRIVEVFGTWCPNCHDASRYLVDLDRRYRERGLSIVGLAFELTGEFERDAQQVRRFAKRHHIEYPLLIGGARDKETVSAALPMIERLRAYPTLLILDGSGRIRAIHAGFSGPATRGEYDAFRVRFEKLIDELLAGRG